MSKSADRISERRKRLAEQDAQEAAVRASVEEYEDVELERLEKLAARNRVIGAALVGGMSIAKARAISGLSASQLSKIKRAYLADLTITEP
jgi:hypothetical protein